MPACVLRSPSGHVEYANDVNLDSAARARYGRDGHYTGGVLRIYRLGQRWVVLDSVSHYYVAIDIAAEVL